jgi:hypothetical protein
MRKSEFPRWSVAQKPTNRNPVILCTTQSVITGHVPGIEPAVEINDEESIRVLLRSSLQAAGYAVTEAVNGREGLGLYRHRPISCS